MGTILCCVFLVSKTWLTHLPLDKIATILADDFLNAFSWMKSDRVPIQILLKFVPRNPFDDKPALVQVMAWCQIGDKPLSQPMLTRLIDAFIRH